MSNSDLKLVGKLGLDLNRLKTDVNSMETIIEEANKHSKKLGQTWQSMAKDMEKAFKNIPLSDLATVLEKLDKAQKNGLDKILANNQKFQADEKRKNELHQAVLLKKQEETNAKIQNANLKALQMMDIQKQRFQNAEIRATESHNLKLQNAMEQHTVRMNKINHSFSPYGLSNNTNVMLDYAIGLGSIVGVTASLKEAIAVNKEFEIGQINLQRILSATDAEMHTVKQTTIDVAKVTGNVFKDIQDIENLWIRSGKSNLDNLKELTQLTAIGLNTAEFKDAAESVAYLVGAINQMADGDISKATDMLDSWVKVADYTAVNTTRDLAEVISKAGSQAKQLGLTFHDLNAITGLLSERMSLSGEEIGTALKSVFSRIQNPTHYKVLEKWGIKVTEIGENGKLSFRNLIDVMDDVHEKFKMLGADGNSVAIAEIEKAMGGTHQRAVVANMIDNWARYGEISKVSIESSGFAMEQNEKIMQSFDKQVAVLKATLMELVLSIGENGLMSVMLGLVQGTQQAVDWFNGLNPHIKNTVIVAIELAVGLGAINLATKKLTQINLVGWISNVIKSFVSKQATIAYVIKAEELLINKVKAGTITEAEREAILKTLKISKVADATATQVQTVAEEAHMVATKSATTATLAFNVAITAGLIAIPMIIGAIATYSKSQDELNQRTLEHIKHTKDEITETERLISEYETLASKTTENTVEKDRLKAIEEKLIELYPQTISGINGQNEAFSNQIEIIKNLTIEKKKSLLDDAELFRDANHTKYNKALEKIAKLEKEKDSARDTLNNSYYAIEYGIEPTDEHVAQHKIKINDKIKKEQEFIDEYKSNLDAIDKIKNALNNVSDSSSYSTNPNTVLPEQNTDNTSYYDPNDYQRTLRELSYKNNIGQINNNTYARELQAILEANRQNITEEEAWSLEEQIYRLNNTKTSNKIDKNNPYSKATQKLAHEYKMDNLTQMQYANELEKVLNSHRGKITQDEIWKAEEQIYSLKTSNIGKLPKHIQEQLDTYSHKSAVGELKDTEHSKLIDDIIKDYANELDGKALRGLKEKSYSLKMKVKPDIEDIDFEQFQSTMREIGFELNELQKQEELMNLATKSKIDLYPILTQKMERYTKSNEELNRANDFYITALEDVRNQIEELDPVSLKYEETLKLLQKQEKDLTSEIQKNTLSMYDNQLAIEKTKAQLEDYVSASLKESYNLQHKMAEQQIESRHNTEMQRIQEEEKAYINALNSRKSAKQKELDMLQEQIKQQEYLNSLTEIQEKIEKVKADTRFAYIDEETGKEIYTYDRAKVAELEKELTKKVTQKQQEEAKQRIQDEIKQIEEEKRITKDGYDEKLRLMKESQQREKEHFDAYWKQRLSDEHIKRITENLIQKEGHEESLRISKEYYEDVKKQYEDGSQEAYEAGKSITSNLSDGLFEEIESIIEKYKFKISEITSLNGKINSSSYSGNSGSSTGKPPASIKDNDVISSSNNFKNLAKYHNGGFIGGLPLNNQHERIAKLLDGELVLSHNQLDRLSLSLPQMTYNKVNNSRNERTNESVRPIVIQIDKLTPNDFDGFMKSIEPYINSHR